MRVNIGEIKTQVEEMNGILAKKEMLAYELLGDLDELIGDDELEGKAFDAMKNYLRDFHKPIVQGLIMAYDEIKNANSTLLSDLYTQVSSDESHQIDADNLAILLQQQKVVLRDLEEKALELSVTMPAAANTTNQYVQQQRTNLASLESEIQKLENFNNTHLTHYSQAEHYLENVATGLNQIKGRSFDPVTKIIKYDTKNLDWSKALNISWNLKEYDKFKQSDLSGLEDSYGFTSEQAKLIKSAFKSLEKSYDGDINSIEYTNWVFGVLASLCISYDAMRFRLTANSYTSEDAEKVLKKAGLNEQEILDLTVLINLQHLPFEQKDFALEDIDISKSKYKNLTYEVFMNNIKGYKKDFAHELIQLAIYSNEIQEGKKPKFSDLFNGKLARAYVDFFNSDTVNSYTNYESSFKGDIDSTRYDEGDFASDIDSINVYENIKNKNKTPYDAITEYNNQINEGGINRAKEFLNNLGEGNEGMGIYKLKEILDVETMGSGFISQEENQEEVEKGGQDFIQWLLSEYNK